MNKCITVLLSVLLVLSMGVCALAETGGGTGRKTWEGETIEHAGFKDLGNYVIELPDYADPEALERGIALVNSVADNNKLPKIGCTTLVKRNSKGEIVIGRNQDLDISQSPGYVYKTTFGKYQTFCTAYIPNFRTTYAELQQQDALDPNLQDFLLFGCGDCLNEKGLYIEMNLREKNDMLTCYGLHTSNGETTRSDGTPWSELRACSICIPQLVGQNCATVAEAIEYLNNSYDWYTVSTIKGVDIGANNSNMCYTIADATGEYGLIEIAQDEISYIPYQYGQANFYITPKWNALDSYACGHGRLATVSKVINSVETLEDAMKAMEPIMWRNETLWLGESHRVTDGTRLHPFNQICFEDNEGNPQMDWRSEYVYKWPVLDDGRMLIEARLYEEAEKSDYDPKIKEYYDEALATGRMIIDDGSMTFKVNGEELKLTELAAKYNEYTSFDVTETEKKKELQAYYDVYYHMLQNQDRAWVHNDQNFEAMKAAAYASLHVRYDKDGKFDPSAMSKYEKLLAYYGVGTEKDEKPLRDDGAIWTTGLNVGVNCMQRTFKVRFWENDEVVYEFSF